MVEFTLPKNSKLTVGKTWPKPDGATNVKLFKIYRFDPEEVSNPKTGLIAGSGGPSTINLLQSFDIAREKGPKRVGPFMVPRCMSSSVSACIATFFKIKGINFSITSACSTSAHCIGTVSYTHLTLPTIYSV